MESSGASEKPTGEWQREVGEYIAPYFDYRKKKHASFRWFGFSKVAASLKWLRVIAFFVLNTVLGSIGKWSIWAFFVWSHYP